MIRRPDFTETENVVAQSEVSKVFLLDGILHYTYVDGYSETLEEATLILGQLKQKLAGKRYPVLVYIDRLKSVAADARALHAGKESGEVYTAVALLVSNPIARIISNFYINIGRPIFPAKMFTSIEEASEWVEAHKS